MKRATGLLTLTVVTNAGESNQVLTPHAFRADLIEHVTPLSHASEHAATVYGAAHAVVHLRDSAYWVIESLETIVEAANKLSKPDAE